MVRRGRRTLAVAGVLILIAGTGTFVWLNADGDGEVAEQEAARNSKLDNLERRMDAVNSAVEENAGLLDRLAANVEGHHSLSEVLEQEMETVKSLSSATNARMDELEERLQDVADRCRSIGAELSKRLDERERRVSQENTEQPNEYEPALLGIDVWGDSPMVLVKTKAGTRRLSEGEVFRGWTVTKVGERAVVFTHVETGKVVERRR